VEKWKAFFALHFSVPRIVFDLAVPVLCSLAKSVVLQYRNRPANVQPAPAPASASKGFSIQELVAALSEGAELHERCKLGSELIYVQSEQYRTDAPLQRMHQYPFLVSTKGHSSFL